MMNDNVLSVQFDPPVVKQIISKHSGSILAKEDITVELSNIVEDKAKKIFEECDQSNGGSGILPSSMIITLLNGMGYSGDVEIMSKIIQKLYEKDDISLPEWLTFLERYQAPAYYYGQRFRKYCGRGQCEDIHMLILRGCDPNSGDGEGLTGLHYAAELNRVTVIEYLAKLLGNKLILNCHDRYGWTPLHSAAFHGNLESVELLIKLGADVHAVEKYGKTALHLAVSQSRNAICDLLVKKGANVMSADCHGMTCLHEATYKGYEKTFQLLCSQKGANLQAKDTFGNTPDYYLNI